MTSSTDASQGFNAGVDMALVTKSGSNQIHGDVFEYNRNAFLESRDWFLPRIGEDNQNQWGWTLGGPVYIPKRYDGRNKTFFFAGIEFERFGGATATVFNPTVPLAAWRGGDFSGLLPAMVVAPVKPGWVSLPAGADLLAVPAMDLLAYPLELAASLSKVAEVAVPLDTARDARLVAFRALDQGIEHMAILVGDPAAQSAPLVRIHSECFTGDLLGSLRCDCGPQLDAAMSAIALEGRGVVLYLRGHEGRGIGLMRKLHAYELQDNGADTIDANLELGLPADARDYGTGAHLDGRVEFGPGIDHCGGMNPAGYGS